MNANFGVKLSVKIHEGGNAMAIHLIQGFFFQKRQWLSPAQVPIIGATVMVNSALCRDMFSGIIFPDEQNILGGYMGLLTDIWGESTISEVIIWPEQKMSFVKKYDKREDLINYDFEFKNGLWVGKFSGSFVGEGIAKCILTTLTDEQLDLLDP